MRVFVIALFLFVSLFPQYLFSQVRYRGMALGNGISTQDIQELEGYLPGSNVVRYPLHNYGADDATEAEYDAWLVQALAELDALLPTFQQYGMKVFLVLATPPGGFQSLEEPALHRIFGASWAQQSLIKTWQTIATHYAGNTAIGAFDLVNEPAQRSVAAGLKAWPELASDVIAAIRAIDATRTIILEPRYGNQVYFNTLKTFFSLSNLIYSFHSYYPSTVIKQGLEGRPTGKKYPKGKLNKKKLTRKNKKAWSFWRQLKKAKKKQGNKADAQMYVGEFSCVRWAPGNTTKRYLGDMIKLFEKNKMHWTMHAWGDDNVWDPRFSSDMNDDQPSPTPTDRATLLKKFFAKN
ncbi:glycoside hydrolase family 5 protein [Oligoflexia bacterium]|nr:glycoside hydrolase family 5 protein [Oligoflexia bacterium]